MVTTQMSLPSFLLLPEWDYDFVYSGLPNSGDNITGLINCSDFGEDCPYPGFVSGKLINQDGSHWTQVEVTFSNQQDLDNFLSHKWIQILDNYIKDCLEGPPPSKIKG